MKKKIHFLSFATLEPFRPLLPTRFSKFEKQKSEQRKSREIVVVELGFDVEVDDVVFGILTMESNSLRTKCCCLLLTLKKTKRKHRRKQPLEGVELELSD